MPFLNFMSTFLRNSILKMKKGTATSIQKHKMYFLILVFMVMALCFFSLMYICKRPYPFKVPEVPNKYYMDPIPTRRDIARRILKIQREIEFQAGFSSNIRVSWAEDLLAIISELDPRVQAIEERRKILPSENKNVSLEGSLSTPLNVCPEVYKGRKYDWMFERNFYTQKCNAKNFKDVVTVVLSTKGWDIRRVKFIIENIKKYYDINIVVLTFGENLDDILEYGIVVKHFTPNTLESTALNGVFSVISTPYTFIAHSLMHFNSHTDLKRLVRVIDNIDISVASGAYRDIIGHWQHGCLQVTAENYQLKYVRGYEHSSHECMYCGDVLGPFVVKTKDLKSLPLTEGLEGSVMYRDWFLKVQRTGRLVMSCPDVMFYVSKESSLSRTDWLQIGKIWSFERISGFDGSNHKFSCEDVEITCNNLLETVASFLVPPCCTEMARKELGFIQDCASELGLYYELQAGTLLGAVKMDGILPWDFDVDVITDCKDQQIWTTKGFDCMTRKGCRPSLQFGNYWTASCQLTVIDISCRYNRTIHLPVEYQQEPTKINVNGRWTTVTSNPGLTVRNQYGPEYLKHAVHWRYSSDNPNPKDDGSGQIPGMWSRCSEPTFHSCLEHFPVDGNLRFKFFITPDDP